MTHVTLDQLRQLVSGDLPPADTFAALSHLAGCPTCAELARENQIFELPPPTPLRNTNLSGFLQSHARFLERLTRERHEAAALFDDFTARRLEPDDPRLRTWGVAERLITESIPRLFTEPHEGLRLARLGLEIARTLNPSLYHPRILADLRARAFGHVGNAQRVLGDLPAAEASLEASIAELELGTHDPLEEGRISEFTAHLHAARQNFREAEAAYKHARRLYRDIGDVHRVGKVLNDLSILAAKTGDAQKALDLVEQAIVQIDPTRDSRLHLTTRHNRILHLQQLGRYEDAQALLEVLRPAYAERGEAINLLRLRCLEGDLARGLNRPREAEAAYRETRQGFLAHGMLFDVALLSLDLAALYFEAGRLEDTKALATETVTLLTPLKIDREVIAALVLFQRAAEAQRLTLGFLKSLSLYLQDAQHHPGRPFQPDS